MMEVVSITETLVNFCRTTGRNIPEYSSLWEPEISPKYCSSKIHLVIWKWLKTVLKEVMGHPLRQTNDNEQRSHFNAMAWYVLVSSLDRYTYHLSQQSCETPHMTVFALHFTSFLQLSARTNDLKQSDETSEFF
jgi:hypothetical protein